MVASLSMRRAVPPEIVPTIVASCPEETGAVFTVLWHYETSGVPEELAKSTDPTVRTAVVAAIEVMAEKRRRDELRETEAGLRTLLTDPDPRVREDTLLPPPLGKPDDRHERLPADLAPALLADPVTRWRVAAIVEPSTLDGALLDDLLRDPDPRVRAGVATNANLPADRLERLAADGVPRVRAAVLVNPATPHSLRCRIYPTVDPAQWRVVRPDWLYVPLSELPGKLAFVTSPFVPFRRAVACDPELPADAVTVLAADDDFLVRHLLCEHHASPPGDLMERTVLESHLITRHDIFRRAVFPLDAVRRFATSPGVERRRAAAGHPRLPADLAAVLSTDDDREVRGIVAANPNLSGMALARLLNRNDLDIAASAFRNPNMPEKHLYGLLARWEARQRGRPN